MELKFGIPIFAANVAHGSNRTFMELKLRTEVQKMKEDELF